MTERIFFLSDVQWPFHDRRALKAIIKFVGEWQPDRVIGIGDLLDLPQPSRWNKGSAGEFEGSVFEDSAGCMKGLLAPLREVYDGPIGMHEGNHDERARTYLAKYAPALAESGAFNMETLLKFDDFGIDLLPQEYAFAPGWLSLHGHMGGVRLSQIAGQTALNAAIKMGYSVVMGHTHRLGVGTKVVRGYGGRVDLAVTGMEIGNVMNMKLASYLRGGTANWQQGFGIVTVDGRHVKAEAVPISAGKFTVDGHVWEV